MVFQVKAVYLIGSTVAIGFFRHSCGRVHDTAALQGGQYSVSSKWISKVELSVPDLGFLAQVDQSCKYQAKLCDVQPIFFTRSGFHVLKELILYFLGFRLVENSCFKKKRRAKD